ncbi:MAG TPA: type II toxin-antitoxin system RelE/ParE family toxin [Thermoanaerobaculia bacterium]|nr:type II toxin-antitoxin system RelE/ParE family toxin [Thermoanaerobaculia bacterium]
MTQLHFFEEASEEAEEATRWYRDRSAAAEAAFLVEFDHAITVVTDAPQRWPRYVAGTRRYVFHTFPYSLVYFVEEGMVKVVAVAHHKRRHGYWRPRLHRR